MPHVEFKLTTVNAILYFVVHYFYFNLNKYQQSVIFLEEYWSDRVSSDFARMTNRHKYYLVTHLRVSIIRHPIILR